MEPGVEEHVLSGFDPESEPLVRRTAAGRLWLAIEFLPPTWAPEEDHEHLVQDGPWADFDKRLTRATGVPVVWEDREWFRIDFPREDTVRAIHQFLLAEKRRVIAVGGCRDPIYAEVRKLDETLKQLNERSSQPQTGGVPTAWPGGGEFGALSESEVARKKDRLKQLSRETYFRLFPDEGWPQVGPNTARSRSDHQGFSASWRTGTAVAVARQIDESGDFSAMPILADALQDAGCDNADVLNHCRAPGVHVRGCWVVDLVLGKE